ncbi:MAG TPA: MlaD family protein, partial [Kofleriaceae bacterium]
MSEINLDELPAPNVHHDKRGRPSAIWIVPIIAILAGATLAVRTYLRAGPTILITFESAEGLEVGKSDVRYKNVPVGKITDIDISEDLQQIVATVQLTRGAANLAVSDTKFWVERPRVGIGGVSGLGTLLSGAYIGVDVGTSTDHADHFTGLEKPPGVTHDQHGKKFHLIAHDAGSLAVRSPVYLRRQQVGSISELALAADGKSVEIEIFID